MTWGSLAKRADIAQLLFTGGVGRVRLRTRLVLFLSNLGGGGLCHTKGARSALNKVVVWSTTAPAIRRCSSSSSGLMDSHEVPLSPSPTSI